MGFRFPNVVSVGQERNNFRNRGCLSLSLSLSVCRAQPESPGSRSPQHETHNELIGRVWAARSLGHTSDAITNRTAYSLLPWVWDGRDDAMYLFLRPQEHQTKPKPKPIWARQRNSQNQLPVHPNHPRVATCDFPSLPDNAKIWKGSIIVSILYGAWMDHPHGGALWLLIPKVFRKSGLLFLGVHPPRSIYCLRYQHQLGRPDNRRGLPEAVPNVKSVLAPALLDQQPVTGCHFFCKIRGGQ